jgi:hypothetical protein
MMKTLPSILVLIIAVLAFLLWTKGCEPPQPKTIEVPAVSAELPAQKPNYVKTEVPKTKVKWRNAPPVYLENPVNDSLVQAYQNVKDSLERFKLYLKAIEVKRFSNTFNDSNLTLTISGQVQGELLSLSPNYTIKARTVEAPSKDLHFRVLLGASVQNNLSFDDFSYSLNLGLQNSKGQVYRLGYARQYESNYIMLGYDHPLYSKYY